MTLTRHRHAFVLAGALALLSILVLAAPAAAAKKKAKLDGQLIAAATTNGSKVEAPILLSQKTAKKLKLGSPVATLRTKASKNISAPNPTGQGTVEISPESLRAGDELSGKAKLKGKRDAVMPKLKGKKLKVTDRESALSVDELTGAVVALYQQFAALNLRVTDLESGLAQLRAEIEALKAQDASLQGQIDSLLGQITDLEAALDALTSVVGGLPTADDLQDVIDSIAALQGELDALEALVGTNFTTLQNQITMLDGELDALALDVAALDLLVTDLCSNVPLACL